MKKLLLLVLLSITAVTLTGCTPPPPLKSDKYLKDKSLISSEPCGPPCWQGITVGQTTFSDAVAKIKANPLFSSVQVQENQGSPAQAAFSTALGEPCCQITANDKGVLNALLVKLSPDVTAGQMIEKYGNPEYVTGVDYSQTEVALALIFPKVGVIAWVTPGDATATMKASDPVVVVMYLAPADFPKLLETATLQGWKDFLPYKTYKDATPVITPRVTVTPR
jgi:hypothetical protein